MKKQIDKQVNGSRDIKQSGLKKQYWLTQVSMNNTQTLTGWYNFQVVRMVLLILTNKLQKLDKFILPLSFFFSHWDVCIHFINKVDCMINRYCSYDVIE